MAVYYRFQHEQPRLGEEVHCFTTLDALRGFARMMKGHDPEFDRMRFWEINGTFVRHDEGDVVARVITAKEIRL